MHEQNKPPTSMCIGTNVRLFDHHRHALCGVLVLHHLHDLYFHIPHDPAHVFHDDAHRHGMAILHNRTANLKMQIAMEQ